MYCYTQDDVEGMSPLEVENMLLYAGAEKKIKQKLKGEWKYRRLQDYFEKKRGKEFSLTFAKLEKISKHPISETMRKDRNRWYRLRELERAVGEHKNMNLAIDLRSTLCVYCKI